MNIKIKNINSNILMFLIVVLIFSYAGILASYKSSMVYSIFLLLLCLLGFFSRKLKLFKIEINWFILILYMLFIIVLNFPKSILYLALFVLGVIILYKKNTDKFFALLIKACKLVSLILATSIMIQCYLPEIFYKFASHYYYYSNQFEMVFIMGNISHKYSGLIYEVSFAAFVLSIGFACYFSDLINNKSKRMVCMLCLTYIYYGVVLTGKRSFILIIPIVACTIILLLEFKKISFKFIFLLVLVLIILILNYNSLIHIVFNILSDGSGSLLQLSSREKYWYIILDMFKRSPIIGSGLNSFDYYFNLSNIKGIHLDFAGAHNSYLQILSEMGLVGASLYFYSLIKLNLRAIKCLSLYRLNGNNEKLNLVTIATFVLFVCMIYAITGNVFYQPQQLITFFLFGNVVINEYDSLIKIRKVKMQ